MTATGRETASPHPPSRRRDFGQWACIRPTCDSYFSLIRLAQQSASPHSSGKLQQRPTCDAVSLRSCARGRPSRALRLVAWRRPFAIEQQREGDRTDGERKNGEEDPDAGTHDDEVPSGGRGEHVIDELTDRCWGRVAEVCDVDSLRN